MQEWDGSRDVLSEQHWQPADEYVTGNNQNRRTADCVLGSGAKSVGKEQICPAHLLGSGRSNRAK